MLGTPLGFLAAAALAAVLAALLFLRGRTRIVTAGAAALALLALAGAAAVRQEAPRIAVAVDGSPAGVLGRAAAARDAQRWEESRRLFADARLAYQIANDAGGEAAAWAGIGDAERALGRIAEARAAYGRARELHQQAGGATPAVHVLFGLERLLDAQPSEFAQARTRLIAAHSILDQVQDVAGAAYVALLRGKFEERDGKYEAARLAYADSAARYERAADQSGIANASFQFGRLALLTGYPDDARSGLERARQTFTALGDAQGTAIALLLRGRLERVTGEWEVSLATLAAAAEGTQDRGVQAEAALGSGEVLRLAGRAAESLAHYQRAVAAFSDLGDPHAVAEAQIGLGRALTALARFDEARAALDAAGVLARDPALRGLVHLYAGDVELAAQQAQRAAELYADAAAAFETAIVPIGVAAARARAAAALLQAGEHMRLHEAAAAAEAALQRSAPPLLAANRLLGLGDFEHFRFDGGAARAAQFAAEYPWANAEADAFVRAITDAIAAR